MLQYSRFNIYQIPHCLVSLRYNDSIYLHDRPIHCILRRGPFNWWVSISTYSHCCYFFFLLMTSKLALPSWLVWFIKAFTVTCNVTGTTEATCITSQSSSLAATETLRSDILDFSFNVCVVTITSGLGFLPSAAATTTNFFSGDELSR
jgi:hypothetical protein